jgi:NAD(P) transhydrogenase subunit alpha
MDALSSQANLAGYKSVLMAADSIGKILPMMTTAAGTIRPSKVVILIFGAGVAGLQAIATAKRLGAVVEVSDIRPETKEQVQSLGGKFIEMKGDSSIKIEGGYVKGVSEEFLKMQQELVAKHVKEADIVITTALIPGKKAPLLVTEEMVKSMRYGSVIVDMAVEQGGNVIGSELNKTVEKHGVTIIGESNIPSLLPMNASDLYARNIETLLLHLADKDKFKWELEEEITKGALITHKGQVVQPDQRARTDALFHRPVRLCRNCRHRRRTDHPPHAAYERRQRDPRSRYCRSPDCNAQCGCRQLRGPDPSLFGCIAWYAERSWWFCGNRPDARNV